MILGICWRRSILKVCELNTIQNFDTQTVSNVILGNNISQFLRLNNWRDVGDGDIKIFLAHLIAMGLVRKDAIEKYWDHGGTVKTPFFETHMGRNTFQAILSNFKCLIALQIYHAITLIMINCSNSVLL